MTTSLPENLKRIADVHQSIKSEIGKVIVGQEAVIDQVLIALLARGRSEVREPVVVDDRAGNCGERISDAAHSTRASRADACAARAPPSAAMSHAHSRCPST